jgi:hypothetical protein
MCLLLDISQAGKSVTQSALCSPRILRHKSIVSTSGFRPSAGTTCISISPIYRQAALRLIFSIYLSVGALRPLRGPRPLLTGKVHHYIYSSRYVPFLISSIYQWTGQFLQFKLQIYPFSSHQTAKIELLINSQNQ